MVPAGLRGLSDGRGVVRYRLDGGFPRRGCGGWSGCKNAFDQLLFPRVPLRYALPWRSWGSVPAGGCGHPPLRQDYGFPRSRRGRCLHRPVAEAPSTTKPAAAKSGAGCIPDFPGPKVTQGQRVSVSDYRKGPPAIPRRRQEGCACADRPAVAFFLFGPCTARFSFGKTKREMGGASPLDMPPAGAGIPRGRRTAAPIPSTGTVPQKFSHFVKTKPFSRFSKE